MKNCGDERLEIFYSAANGIPSVAAVNPIPNSSYFIAENSDDIRNSANVVFFLRDEAGVDFSNPDFDAVYAQIMPFYSEPDRTRPRRPGTGIILSLGQIKPKANPKVQDETAEKNLLTLA